LLRSNRDRSSARGARRRRDRGADALLNLRALLAQAGLGFQDIVKTTLFMTDLAQFDLVNRIYGEHLTAPYPARSTVQVAALPRGALIEIEAIACRDHP
jgi:2-iminobutanoate/2-iminopropanoate deaminase